MPLQTVRNVLVASAGVTALVSTRVAPVVSAQNTTLPCVTLSVLSADPLNDLSGHSGLDECRVLVTAWAATYDVALAIATACRTALEAAGHICESRQADQFNADPDPGLYRVEHQYIVWM